MCNFHNNTYFIDEKIEVQNDIPQAGGQLLHSYSYRAEIQTWVFGSPSIHSPGFLLHSLTIPSPPPFLVPLLIPYVVPLDQIQASPILRSSFFTHTFPSLIPCSGHSTGSMSLE